MEHYDVFISYSRKDIEIVNRIEKEFNKYNISYFIDRNGIELGEDYTAKIVECIQNCDVLLFVWTENSNQLKYTANEIMQAIDFNKPIVPFKIGRFKPDLFLEYSLVNYDLIEAFELNEELICSMAARLAAQLGKSKV